jgi:hypothetical protein
MSGPCLLQSLSLSQHFQRSIHVVARTNGDPQLWITPMAQTLPGRDVVVLDPFTFDSCLNLALYYRQPSLISGVRIIRERGSRDSQAF